MSDDEAADGSAENIDLMPKTAQPIGAYNKIRNPPVRKIVEAQIAEFETLIKQRKEFLASLDAMPGIEDVLDKMRKLNI